MRIPAPLANGVEIRFASLLERDHFDPSRWRRAPLQPIGDSGYWSIDVDALAMPDGDYEYDFVLDGDAANPIADPYATEIDRFGDYRGIFRIRAGKRWELPFRWDDELCSTLGVPTSILPVACAMAAEVTASDGM